MQTWDELKQQPEYSFLNSDERMKRVGYVTLGGSHAYGTNVPTSDTDIRGWYMESAEEVLGMNVQEGQFENAETDTVFYSFRKYIKLLTNCNPNVIESLGTRDDHVLYANEIAKQLRDNADLFLSKRAFVTFAGYATAQLRRLENALARDSYTQPEKEQHILQSLEAEMLQAQQNFRRFESMEPWSSNQKAFREFLRKRIPIPDIRWLKCLEAPYFARIVNGDVDYDTFMKYAPIIVKTYKLDNKFRLYIDASEREDMETEIYVDANIVHVPLRDYLRINSEMTNMLRNYGKLNKRNHKKDEAHLNKHAMHLIRLYYMGIDILEKQQIITYRTDEHDLLMSIRNGEMPFEDLFALQKDLEAKLLEAKEKSTLPDNPRYKDINQFVVNTMKKELL